MKHSEIVSVAIHPGIGIARVGNSKEKYFIGPEVPYPDPKPPGFYRDAKGALKRQAARFRIYGLDAQGHVVREITADDAKIEWTVEVANKKAAWYQFVTAMDIPEAVPVGQRNAQIQGAERKKLAITPPPCSIQGRSQRGKAYRLMGKFFDQEVYLGELATDEAGRLVFLGGHGVSRAVTPEAKPYTFGNNDGWHDDVSDGPVGAVVHLGGRELHAKPAWVVVAPPNYAPDLIGIITMYDVLASTYIGNWGAQKSRPSFTQDIYPILERFCMTQWVNQGFFAQFGWGAPYEFLRQLDALSQAGDTFKERRVQIFNQLRYPQQITNVVLTAPNNTALSAGSSIGQWPAFYGDAVTLSNINPNAYLPVTDLMYQYLSRWAAGDFDADWNGPPPHPRSIDEVPLAEQPATLDRAAMEFCLGGPFHPGCEMTWPMRNSTIYTEPFRIRRWPAGTAEIDYGNVLTPDQVFLQQGSSPGPTLGGPLYFQGPGDLTRWMAIPWQTDSSSCRSGYSPEYDPYLPTFWPQRVPNQVLTEATYKKIMHSSPAEGLIELQSRAVWYRFLGPDTDYLGQIDTMIHRFGDLGLVERRPGPGSPELPAEMYVETGVQFKDEVPYDQGKVMLVKEKLTGMKRRS
ncbi:MAG TPA: LodA/GoxA family CTQ-dependent oxidase [Thermoanaerobaculia bacterium]|nr:LodA/GoxA family CTQ-dependent oxidase [Thermoanaerobaculia bacterium]